MLLPIRFLHRGLNRLLKLEAKLSVTLVTDFDVFHLVSVLFTQLKLIKVFRHFTAFLVPRVVLWVLQNSVISIVLFRMRLRFAVSAPLGLLLLR